MTTLQQNRCGEWTFTSQGKHDDPFNQIELTVCFTHAVTGAEKRVPAFWAGGREWRVRFAAHEVGTYRFRTECSDTTDRGLHGQEAQVKVTPYKGANPLYRHGPVRVAANRRHFEKTVFRLLQPSQIRCDGGPTSRPKPIHSPVRTG